MTLPDTMRAIAIDRFGGPEELKLQERPVPRPGPSEVLIKIEFAGVGVWDALERDGAMADLAPESATTFPRIIGADGSGTVAAVGDLSAAIAAFAPDGLDAVLAFVNADRLDKAIAAVRAGGRVAHPYGVPPPGRPGQPGVKVIAFKGAPGREVIDKLNALIESREFSVHISRHFALADAPREHPALKDHHPGRMILTVA